MRIDRRHKPIVCPTGRFLQGAVVLLPGSVPAGVRQRDAAGVRGATGRGAAKRQPPADSGAVGPRGSGRIDDRPEGAWSRDSARPAVCISHHVASARIHGGGGAFAGARGGREHGHFQPVERRAARLAAGGAGTGAAGDAQQSGRLGDVDRAVGRPHGRSAKLARVWRIRATARQCRELLGIDGIAKQPRYLAGPLRRQRLGRSSRPPGLGRILSGSGRWPGDRPRVHYGGRSRRHSLRRH